ncbi:MAG TPA: DUF1553 domain-containing protein [Planctomycetota bacterium]
MSWILILLLAQGDPEGVAFFESKVRPVLVEKCYSCHSAKAPKIKGGLRVDTPEDLLKGGDTGPAVVPGKPDQSLLLKAVRRSDPDLVMPPKETLAARAVEDLDAWIRRGAPMPAAATSSAGADFWTFQPLRDTPGASIDSLLRAKLKEKGLGMSPPADRRTLLRRIAFGLTGLPPENLEEEVDAAIERLLGSTAYGERWARHWLDLARFAETHGFEYNKVRPNAWPYRDWLIRAFNADLPYDRFVRAQIAGDVLDEPDGTTAAAFLVCGAWDEVGHKQQSAVMRARVREEELEDVIATVGQTFLGLTVNCARCHNHKFAPIRQEEYFRWKSVFEGVVSGERPLPDPRAAEIERELAGLKGRPAPIARWDFEGDARDALGALHAELLAGAKVEGGRLRLDGQGAHAKTQGIRKDLIAKTLEVRLALPTRAQGGGGAISVEAGVEFDSLVFAEREPGKWMAGSTFFRRTRDLEGPGEDAEAGQLVHLAAAYHADGTIALYRNGRPYGQPYKKSATPVVYRAHEARVLFGLRHSGGGKAFLEAEIEDAALYDRALSPDEVLACFEGRAPDPDAEARRRVLADELAKLRQGKPSTAWVGTRAQPEAPTKRLLRGDVEKPAEVVAPGGLEALGQGAFGMSPDAPEGERRVRFAAWIAGSPQAARTIVNRVWHLHFGRGLVSTTNDLGPTGELPSHPELLDWLALRFLEDGMSLKKLHRRILASEAYRQGSRANAAALAVDADDKWLWRWAPRRLEAEAIRDAMLAAAGRLAPDPGGASFKPFDVQSQSGTTYFALKDAPDFDRRSVYRFNAISGKDVLLDAFDAPDPGLRVSERRATSTPLQALVLLNDPFVRRMAATLAERVKGDVALAWRLTLGRDPSADEAARAAATANEHGMSTVAWALFNSAEFLHVR